MLSALFFIIIYALLQIICLPIIAILLCAVHLRRRGTDSLTDRLGLVPSPPRNRPVFWFHAVSVGETLALQEVIATIKREHPAAWIHVTSGTPSGRAMAKQYLNADSISYIPYDLVPCMLLAYARIRPQAIVVMEAELWPALFFIAKLKGIPLFLLNARISKRSGNITVVRCFMRLLFNSCSHILAQSNAGYDAFITLGIKPAKVTALGNIKAFNVYAKKQHTPIATHPLSYPVLLAGSIHPTEDLLYLKTFTTLKPLFPHLKCILVPRHFHWQNELIQHVAQTGFSYTVWTAETETADVEASLATNDILIVCRLGELFSLYQHATIFFLGGTFVPVEGHNLLEPAAWGIPSVVGPRHAHCNDTFTQLEAINASICAHNETDLISKTQKLLADKDQLKYMQRTNSIWIKKEAHRVENTMRSVLFRSLFSNWL